MMLLAIWFLTFSTRFLNAEELNSSKFPEDFLFGTASSAYQIEGAWNQDGKGENIWDHIVHNNPTFITNNDTGDVACDSYNKIEEDVQLLKDMGVDFYRFSLSWSRILPTGFPSYINNDGVNYYTRLINLLKLNGIKAHVTIYHWDLPQPLEELGGWLNSSIIDWYLDFANVVFEQFGENVDTWFTFNEPFQICREGYGSAVKAPAVSSRGVGDYICGHNLLRAHAKAYHLYNNTYRSIQNGKIGIVVQAPWAEPASSSDADIDAANRLMQFYFGWFTHPIFTSNGNYPSVMIERVGKRSALEGFNTSRLPSFTEEEIEELKGTSDFFGINHYTSVLVSELPFEIPIMTPDYTYDLAANISINTSWPVEDTSLLRVVPFGFRKVLLFIKDEYNNPDIYITENGFADDGKLNDTNRINFHKEYLSAVLDAMDQGALVKVYALWSFLDDFEWTAGYSEKFGLIQVDFNSINRTRTPKSSVDYYKYVMKTRKVTGYRKNNSILCKFLPFLCNIFLS